MTIGQIIIIAVFILIMLGVWKVINFMLGWHKDLDYTRRRLDIWYSGNIVESFTFGHHQEQEVIDKADAWIKENKERIEKYCK